MALVNALKGGAVLLGLALTGAVIGATRSGMAGVGGNDDGKEKTIRIPRILDGMEPLKDALLTLSQCKDADCWQLERVCRRCASLVQAYVAVSNADPSTVKPSIIALGSKYTASVKSHLHYFYTCSSVPLVAVDRQMLPVNTDLKHAHETIMSTLECLTDALELVAREKIERGVSERI